MQGHYTKSLLFPALLGIPVFIFDRQVSAACCIHAVVQHHGAVRETTFWLHSTVFRSAFGEVAPCVACVLYFSSHARVLYCSCHAQVLYCSCHAGDMGTQQQLSGIQMGQHLKRRIPGMPLFIWFLCCSLIQSVHRKFQGPISFTRLSPCRMSRKRRMNWKSVGSLAVCMHSHDWQWLIFCFAAADCWSQTGWLQSGNRYDGTKWSRTRRRSKKHNWTQNS